MKAKTIPLLFSFSVVLIFLASSGYAYTDFSYNSYMTNTINGYMYYNTTPISPTWNATCSGETGCMLLTGSGATNYAYVHAPYYYSPIIDNYTFDSPYRWNLTVIKIPAYTETIITFAYKTNVSLTLPRIAALDATYYLYDTLNSTDLGTTANSWINTTMIVAPAATERFINAYFIFGFSADPTLIEIDRFKVYTFDVNTARSSIFIDNDTETATYCGNATQTTKHYTEKNDNPGYYVNALVSNLTYDNIGCCAYQLNYTVKARSCSIYQSSGNNIYYSRDIAFLYDTYASPLFILALNKNTLTYSGWFSKPNPCTVSNLIYFNGAGTYNWNCGSLNTTTSQYLFHATLDWSSRNFSGTTFKSYGGSGDTSSPFYALFGESPFTPSCTCSDGIKMCLSYPNSITNESCGTCGCNAAGTDCFFTAANSSVGTWCLTNTTYISYISDNATCSLYTLDGTCPTGSACLQDTATQSISCINNVTGQHQNCVNATGFLVTCGTSGTSNSTMCETNGVWSVCPTAATNPAGSLAVLLGTAFGVTDSGTALAVFSVIISLVLGILVLYYTRNSPQAPAAFAIATLASLVAFTVMGWFPIIFMIVMAIVAGLILVKTMNIGV